MITRHGDKLRRDGRADLDRDRQGTHGFEVVASKDGRLFRPDQIGQWDAFVFETTGDLNTPGGDQRTRRSSRPTARRPSTMRSGAEKDSWRMHCAIDTFGHHGPKISPAR